MLSMIFSLPKMCSDERQDITVDDNPAVLAPPGRGIVTADMDGNKYASTHIGRAFNPYRTPTHTMICVIFILQNISWSSVGDTGTPHCFIVGTVLSFSF